MIFPQFQPEILTVWLLLSYYNFYEKKVIQKKDLIKLHNLMHQNQQIFKFKHIVSIFT